MYFLSSRENFSSPVGKCKFKYRSLTSDHFSEEGTGHVLGQGVPLAGLLGKANYSTYFVPLWAQLSSLLGPLCQTSVPMATHPFPGASI